MGTKEESSACLGSGVKLLKPKASTLQILAMATALTLGPWAVALPYYFSMTGPSIWLSFLIGVILITPIVFAYGELTAMLPFAGGEYVFARQATNRPMGFGTGWLLMLVYLVTVSFMAAGVLRISMLLFGADEFGRWIFPLIATGIALVFILLNILDVRVSLSVQLIAAAVLIVSGIIVQSAFFASPNWSVANLQPHFPMGIGGLFAGVGVLASMYFGFDIVPQLSEESNYPKHRQIWVMLGAIWICGLFYIFIALGNAGMAPMDWLIEQLAIDPALVQEFGMGNFLYVLALIAALLALLTTLNGFIVGASRLIFALGRSRVLPPVLGKVNRSGVPHVALWTVLIVAAVVLFVAGEDWVAMITSLASGLVTLVYAFMAICAIILRRTHPEWKRPYRVPGGPIIFGVAIPCGLFISFFAFREVPSAGWWFLLAYVVVGLLVYGLMTAKAGRDPDWCLIELGPEDLDKAHEVLQA